VPRSARSLNRRNRGQFGRFYLLHIYFYRIDTMIVTAARWLARLQHDLVKRLLWPARDRRDLGGAPAPGELVAPLIDDQGAPTTAAALWSTLRAEQTAERGATDSAALRQFGEALEGALAAAEAGDVAGVLGLESAFAELARSLDESER
jgi:hypothetical protein